MPAFGAGTTVWPGANRGVAGVTSPKDARRGRLGAAVAIDGPLHSRPGCSGGST